MSGDEQLSHLDASLLGTKEHWDEVYARELDNHSKDQDDEGTVWFDENGAEDAVVKLLYELTEDGLLFRHGPHASRVIDLGCGNGHMLFTLRQDEDDAWTGRMVGVDYSAASIQLAQQIADRRQVEDDVTFHVWDILKEEPGPWIESGFDLMLDKGTFDAISLMTASGDGPHPCAVYLQKVATLMQPGNLLVITSCNWTKTELLAWLTRSETAALLHVVAEAKYPSFTFGGNSGQSIVTLAFVRR